MRLLLPLISLATTASALVASSTSEEHQIWMRLKCMANACGEHLLPICDSCVATCASDSESYGQVFTCMESYGCLDRNDCFPDKDAYKECAEVCLRKYDIYDI